MNVYCPVGDAFTELGKVVFAAGFGYAKHLALDMVSLRCLLDILAEILIKQPHLCV